MLEPRERSKYLSSTHGRRELSVPKPEYSSGAHSTRGFEHNGMQMLAMSSSDALLVVLGRSASKRSADAAGERLDMGALTWLTALARGRGGITPRVTRKASREGFDLGQRTARAKSEPLKAVRKPVAVGLRKLQPT